MGKSAKLIKAFLKGLKVSARDKGGTSTGDIIYSSGPLTLPSQGREHEQRKSRGKESSRWGLGRSTSRNWESETEKAHAQHMRDGGESRRNLQVEEEEQVQERGDVHAHTAVAVSEEALYQHKQEEHLQGSGGKLNVDGSCASVFDPDKDVKESREWRDYADRAAKPSVGDCMDEEEDEEFIVKNFTHQLEELHDCNDVEMANCGRWRRDLAARVIQTAFRGYLARRALRALKGVVRLQALARGRLVRRQAAATLRCVHALVRVQARVRARRVRMSEEGQAVQRQLQQQRRPCPPPLPHMEWDNSPATPQQLQAKAQYRQVAAMKRERALAYAFSEQLRRCAPEQSSFVIDCKGDKNHWGWRWLERWMAARPWESSFPDLAREHVSVMNVMDTNLFVLNKNVNSNMKGGPSPPKSSPFVKKRSLSIPDNLLNSLENIVSPGKSTPPSLPSVYSKFNSLGPQQICNPASSPGSRSAALAFDAAQPLLSSPYRLRLSLPTLSSLSTQKSPAASTKNVPSLSAASSFKDCGATIEKDRIVAEALKGPANLRRSRDDGSIGCVSKEKRHGLSSNGASNMKVLDEGNAVSKEKVKVHTLRRERSAKANNYGDAQAKPDTKAVSFGDHQGKANEEQGPECTMASTEQTAEPSLPGYMQSTQSTTAKARPTSCARGNNHASPAKKSDGSPASASRRRGSLSPASDPKGQLSGSDSSHRFITNVRTGSSRTLLASFKEQQ